MRTLRQAIQGNLLKDWTDLLFQFYTEDWQYLTDDAWLFKNGVSTIVRQGYQSQGLKLPDRFNFDIRKPRNRDGSH